MNKATILIRLEKFEDAIECCDKALKIKPMLLPALFLKVRTLQTIEKFEESVGSLGLFT